MVFEEIFNAPMVDPDDPDDDIAFLATALPPNFTREQVELLRLLAIDHMPSTIRNATERDLWLHDYLHMKKRLMEATPGVASPFAWMRKAVSENWT